MSSGPDPFLVVGIVILMILMLIINTYLLIHWQHPEDKNESVLARLLILFGFQLSSVSVLMLPIGTVLLIFMIFLYYIDLT